MNFLGSTTTGHFIENKENYREFGLYKISHYKFLASLPGTLVSLWWQCQKFDQQVFVVVAREFS